MYIFFSESTNSYAERKLLILMAVSWLPPIILPCSRIVMGIAEGQGRSMRFDFHHKLGLVRTGWFLRVLWRTPQPMGCGRLRSSIVAWMHDG